MKKEGVNWVCTCEKKKKEDIQITIYDAVQLGKKAEMELVEEARENVEIKEMKRLRELLRQIGEEREKNGMKENDAEVNVL